MSLSTSELALPKLENLVSSSLYVTYPQPNPGAALRLFCFPYAGGSANLFRAWLPHLPRSVELCPIELPGRGTRLAEAPLTHIEPLVAAIAQAIKPHLDRPFAFFGHSMGALIGFELARTLHQSDQIAPVHLLVSGREAPQIPDQSNPIHSLPEPEFIAALRRLQGTPAEVLDHAELMELLMPLLRADFAVVETYPYTAGPALPCPITAFGGLQDDEVSQAGLQAWQLQTSDRFAVEMLPGNHFFLHSAQTLLLQKITGILNQAIAQLVL